LPVGVRHPVESLTLVRRADATSWENDTPAGEFFFLQVRLNLVEPSGSSFVRNLLANDDVRAALADEPEKLGPEVPVVVESLTLACGAEWLAWTGSAPHGTVIGPSGLPECVRPD